eukprot:3929669-Amphidinium_carterae.2
MGCERRRHVLVGRPGRLRSPLAAYGALLSPVSAAVAAGGLAGVVSSLAVARWQLQRSCAVSMARHLGMVQASAVGREWTPLTYSAVPQKRVWGLLCGPPSLPPVPTGDQTPSGEQLGVWYVQDGVVVQCSLGVGSGTCLDVCGLLSLLLRWRLEVQYACNPPEEVAVCVS